MTCAEFQRVLPNIIETGGNAKEEEHLRNCPVCADLVQDLRYIAEQAKLLVPMKDPSPKVWEGLEESLQREGLVRPAGARGRLLGPGRWGPVPWLMMAAVLALLGLSLVLALRANMNRDSAAASNAPALTNASALGSQQDQEVLTAVSQTNPTLRPSYEDGLRRVNAYISDAEHRLRETPNDEELREFVLKAYQQKAMLYEMAMSRSLP
jgi:predicted anti-sigma-YlaC factor YlaD